MSFASYIYAIIKGMKTGAQAGLNAFFEETGSFQTEYSKQAFSKGRQRIKPEAFMELAFTVATEFYSRAELQDWNGYHLFGIDGTLLSLPCTKELTEIYGTHISQGTPQVQSRVSCVYDVLNGMIVDTRISPCGSSEIAQAEEMIRAFSMSEKPVFLLDRGYPSAELLQLFEQLGYKYVMRCSRSFVRSMSLPSNDNVLTHKFNKAKAAEKIRVVKVPLSDDSTEYLVTNIFDEISIDEFKWLYHMRWEIEKKYDELKNKLEIENFSGYTPDAILQDYYATLFLSNLTSVLKYDIHEEIEQDHNSPENKYQYQINVRQTIIELRHKVVEMLSAKNKVKRAFLLQQIANRLSKAVVPVRPNRSEPRIQRHRSQKYPQNKKHI